MPASKRRSCAPHRVIIIIVGISEASKKIKNSIRSDAVNASRVVSCKKAALAMYVRCRGIGSLDSLLWLASSVRGKSQHVRMASGPDR